MWLGFGSGGRVMFGRKSLHDQHAKAIAEIDYGRRRAPLHDIPVAPKKRGPIDPVDHFAFDAFAWLGVTLDFMTAAAWSFEETSDTMRRAPYLDSPAYGRRWVVYYNALRLGWLEVSASPERLFCSVDDFRTSPQAQIDMELLLMQFVPVDDASNILYQAAHLMQAGDGGDQFARGRAQQAAESAMTRYLWDVMRAGERFVPILSFSVKGPYEVYRQTLMRWEAAGFDPQQRLARRHASDEPDRSF